MPRNEEVVVVRLLSPDDIKRVDLGRLVHQQLEEGLNLAIKQASDPDVVNYDVERIARLRRFYVRCIFKRPLSLLRNMVAFYMANSPDKDDPGVRYNAAEIIKSLGLDVVSGNTIPFVPPVKYAAVGLSPSDIVAMFDVSEDVARDIVMEHERECYMEAVAFYRQMAKRLGEKHKLTPRA